MRLALPLAAIALSAACVLRAAEPPEVKRPDDQPAGRSRKLKVFILAGQSNMEDHAKVETFDYIAPLTKGAIKSGRCAITSIRNTKATPTPRGR